MHKQKPRIQWGIHKKKEAKTTQQIPTNGMTYKLQRLSRQTNRSNLKLDFILCMEGGLAEAQPFNQGSLYLQPFYVISFISYLADFSLGDIPSLMLEFLHEWLKNKTCFLKSQ